VALPALPALVILRDVGPRDGLQHERPVSVDDRVRLVDALAQAGMHRVEVGAFVSPADVPAMDGAAELLALLPRESIVRYSALVPNLRGAELALETDVDELTVAIALTDADNQRNVGRTVEESVADVEKICALADEIPVDAVLDGAFGSCREGDVSPRSVGALAQRLREAGCASITCADSSGMATPRGIEEVLGRTGSGIGLHLHDTRGTAMVNAFAAMQLGVDRFDTAIGGLGGTLAAEDMVALLHDLKVRTGIDLDRLLAAADVAAGLVEHPLPSRVAHVGPRTRLVQGD
jgi:hydroxymethylglutaryl-CoA lyase